VLGDHLVAHDVCEDEDEAEVVCTALYEKLQAANDAAAVRPSLNLYAHKQTHIDTHTHTHTHTHIFACRLRAQVTRM
jgi:hypothetical protein